MSRWEIFNDQVIVITGAASGFGKILATKLAAEGAKLVLGDINEEPLRAVAEGLNRAENVAWLTGDVAQERDVSALVDLARERYGCLNIMVNNAGLGTPPKSIIEITEEEMDLNYSVNAKGVFFGIKHAIRQMLQQSPRGGIVLNVASMAGLGAAPLIGAYAAAKHAVVGLTKTAAYEFANQDIRVNAICPFFSPTPLVTEGEGLGDKLDALSRATPMQRLGDPEEMVEVMLMLMSPANSFMNGNCVAVDGGMSAI
jgi:NAD(P)-dependent dehydrogenase (short-subunit alcohol dehydrogenase family)